METDEVEGAALSDEEAVDAVGRFCVVPEDRGLVMRQLAPGEQAPYRLCKGDVMALLSGHLELGYAIRMVH